MVFSFINMMDYTHCFLAIKPTLYSLDQSHSAVVYNLVFRLLNSTADILLRIFAFCIFSRDIGLYFIANTYWATSVPGIVLGAGDSTIFSEQILEISSSMEFTFKWMTSKASLHSHLTFFSSVFSVIPQCLGARLLVTRTSASGDWKGSAFLF